MSDQVSADIFEILLSHAENKPESMDAGTVLSEAGIDSLALVEIIFDLEEKFDITIPNPDEIEGMDTAFETAGDVVKAVKTLLDEKG
ncbi:MAG: acyl carrier protein [Gammaproteobacteria bacterium]|nr:acyl carrier protein [Gammaproteobacteria bacterium]MCP5136414.1 acyl carrier protein [Gammaproteobacteria bacterium]